MSRSDSPLFAIRAGVLLLEKQIPIPMQTIKTGAAIGTHTFPRDKVLQPVEHLYIHLFQDALLPLWLSFHICQQNADKGIPDVSTIHFCRTVHLHIPKVSGIQIEHQFAVHIPVKMHSINGKLPRFFIILLKDIMYFNHCYTCKF